MTKQLTFNGEAEATAILDALEMELTHLFKEGTDRYSYVVKHPDQDCWAIRIDMGGVYWTEVKTFLSNNNLTPTEISEDWILKLDDLS